MPAISPALRFAVLGIGGAAVLALATTFGHCGSGGLGALGASRPEMPDAPSLTRTAPAPPTARD